MLNSKELVETTPKKVQNLMTEHSLQEQQKEIMIRFIQQLTAMEIELSILQKQKEMRQSKQVDQKIKKRPLRGLF